MDHQQRALFPTLKNAAILQCMEEVNVPLTEAELTEPGRCKERVREVFAQLLQLCWGRSAESLASVPPRVLARQRSLPHPSIYNDALPETKFFTLLSRLLRICGYAEFGFRDLAAPQAKRFRRQLSALINFLKYREDTGHVVAQAQEEREELFAATEEAAENAMALNHDLEEARAVNHEKMLEREEAEAECKEMEAELAQQNKTQSAIRQETLILKKSANELNNEIKNLSIALRELQAEERRLSKEVVASPECIKLDLARATEELEAAREGISEKRKEKERVLREIAATAAAEEGVKLVVSELDEIETRVQEHELAAEDCEDARSELRGKEHGVEERRAEAEEQERKREEAETQRADELSALTSALRDAHNDLDSAAGRLGVVESERIDGIAQIESGERRIEDLRARTECERQVANDEIAGRIASFRKFEQSFWAREKQLSLPVG